MLKMKTSLMVLSLASAGALAATTTHKSVSSPENTTYVSSMDGGGSYNPSPAVKAAVGVEHYAAGAGGFNGLHGMFEIVPNSTVGLGFGFGGNFHSLIAMADFRHMFIHADAASVFGEVDAGMVKPAAGASVYFAPALLGGFGYALTSRLNLTLAYGLQFAFGGGQTQHIAFTNTEFVGNFGIHWHL